MNLFTSPMSGDFQACVFNDFGYHAKSVWKNETHRCVARGRSTYIRGENISEPHDEIHGAQRNEFLIGLSSGRFAGSDPYSSCRKGTPGPPGPPPATRYVPFLHAFLWNPGSLPSVVVVCPPEDAISGIWKFVWWLLYIHNPQNRCC